MSVYVCPGTVVAAPCAEVWEVLNRLPTDAAWLGVEVWRADPPGTLQPGQTLVLSTVALGRRWNIKVEVGAVDAAPSTKGRASSTCASGCPWVSSTTNV